MVWSTCVCICTLRKAAQRVNALCSRCVLLTWKMQSTPHQTDHSIRAKLRRSRTIIFLALLSVFAYNQVLSLQYWRRSIGPTFWLCYFKDKRSRTLIGNRDVITFLEPLQPLLTSLTIDKNCSQLTNATCDDCIKDGVSIDCHTIAGNAVIIAQLQLYMTGDVNFAN